MTQTKHPCLCMTALHGGKPPVTVRRIFSCVPGTGAAGTALALRRLPLSDARSPPGTRPTDVSRSLSHNVFYYTEACRNVKNKYELFLNKYNFDESWQILRAAHTMKREEMTMFSYLFTFRSQTAAQSGRRILYESGLRAQLRRAPPEISEPRLHVGAVCGRRRRRPRRAAAARVEQPGFRRVPDAPERVSGGGGAVIYLDAGATTLQKPPDGGLRRCRAPCAAWPRPAAAAYAPAMRAADAVYDCRVLAAAAVWTRQPEQVVFTMNATHALNLAIKTLVRPGGRAVISGFEHNAVVAPAAPHRRGDRSSPDGRLFDPADTLAAFDSRRHAGHAGRRLHACVQCVRLYPAAGGNRGALPRAAGAADRRRVAVGGAAAVSVWQELGAALRLHAGT